MTDQPRKIEADSPIEIAVAALSLADPVETPVAIGFGNPVDGPTGISFGDPAAPASDPAKAPEAPAAERPARSPAPHPAELPAAPIKAEGRFTRALPAITAALALFASTVSVTGVIVMGGTVKAAAHFAEDAEQRQAQLADTKALIAELKELRVKETAALARLRAAKAVQPATYADIQRMVDDLRNDMQRTDPMGSSFDRVYQGQSALAERLGALSLKVEHLQDVVRSPRPTIKVTTVGKDH